MKKKIMLVMAVLMLAAPASAEVKIICAADGYDVTVSYNAGSEVELVRAFALDIEVSSGATITDFNTVPSFDNDYPIHPGSIVIIGNDVNDYGSPICDPCVYPGTLPGLNSSGITVEYGSLYVGDGNAPDPCGVMFTFTVSGDCIVTIAENRILEGILTMRGGVVLEDPTLAVDVNSPGITLGCVVPDVVGMTETDANMAIVDANFVCASNYAYDAVVPAGDVISQDPVGGTAPGCETTVDITVSLGPSCIVPDVVGMTEADANMAIVAAGFTVAITYDYSDLVADGDVISQDPAGLVETGCGTEVAIVVSLGSDCYLGMDDVNKAEWVAMEKPVCWCYPRQCHGDADGIKHGAFGQYWYVGQPDLDIMGVGWLVKTTANGGRGILDLEYNGVPAACADFDHRQHGAFGQFWRIGQPDLDEMGLYWLKKEGSGDEPLTDCPPGNRTP